MPISSYWIFFMYKSNMAKSINLSITECVMLFYMKKNGTQLTTKRIFSYTMERMKLLEEVPKRLCYYPKGKRWGLEKWFRGLEDTAQCQFSTVHSIHVRQFTSPLSNFSSQRI